MTVRGKLGDAPISKDYQLTATQTPEGNIAIETHGKGTVAGVPEQVDAHFRLSR